MMDVLKEDCTFTLMMDVLAVLGQAAGTWLQQDSATHPHPSVLAVQGMRERRYVSHFCWTYLEVKS